MHAHFEKEEEYALPPLGVLARSGQRQNLTGHVRNSEDGRQARNRTPLHALRTVAIVAALRTLIDGAKAEGRPEYVHFAEKLMCACAHGGKGVLSDSAAPVTSRPPCLTRRSRPLDDVKPESARRPRWRESCAGGTCAREHERSQIDAFFLTIAQS
jgi:hypothetical protein